MTQFESNLRRFINFNVRRQFYEFDVIVVCYKADVDRVKNTIESTKPKSVEQNLLIYQKGKINKTASSIIYCKCNDFYSPSKTLVFKKLHELCIVRNLLLYWRITVASIVLPVRLQPNQYLTSLKYLKLY